MFFQNTLFVPLTTNESKKSTLLVPNFVRSINGLQKVGVYFFDPDEVWTLGPIKVVLDLSLLVVGYLLSGLPTGIGISCHTRN